MRFYTEDETGKINRLILDDATGDMATYGILTSVNEIDANMTVMGQYQYVINGQAGSIVSQNGIYGVTAGPALIELSAGGIQSLKNLKETALTSVSTVSARNGGQEYGMAEAVQVYIRRGSSYTLSTLSAVDDLNEYTLRGFYDKEYAQGGRIRVIIATEK